MSLRPRLSVKTILGMLLTLSGLPAAGGDSSAVGGPPAHSRWELTFEDEFNAPALDETKWQVYNGSCGHILSSRWRENVEVKDGNLRLLTKKETRAGQDWTTGHMWSRTFRQAYGYWEARYKYGKGRALNNAFWMITTGLPKGSTAQRFEIDINEGHTPGNINMNLHNWSGEHWSKPNCYRVDQDLSETFHVYGFEWTPERLIWYFDGQVIRELPHTICQSETPVYFSSAVLKGYPPEDYAEEDLKNGIMEVDWVRIWKRLPDPPTADSTRLEVSAVTGNSLALSWPPARDNQTAAGDLRYLVYLADAAEAGNPGEPPARGRLVQTLAGQTQAQLKGLRHSHEYRLTVVAVDESGEELAYAGVTAKTVALPPAPPPVPGRDGKLAVDELDGHQARLTWEKATAGAGDPARFDYFVYVTEADSALDSAENCEALGAPAEILTDGAACRLGQLKSGTNYRGNVVVIDEGGARRAYSAVEFATRPDLSPPAEFADFGQPETGLLKDAQLNAVEIVTDAELGRKVGIFDGVRSYAALNQKIPNRPAMTVTGWLWSAGAQNDFAGLFYSRASTSGIHFGGRESDSVQQLVARWNGSQGGWNWRSGLRVPAEKWVLFALAIDPQKLSLYLADGEILQCASQLGENRGGPEFAGFELGRDSYSTDKRCFKGRLADLRVYTRCLSAKEVKCLAQERAK